MSDKQQPPCQEPDKPCFMPADRYREVMREWELTDETGHAGDAVCDAYTMGFKAAVVACMAEVFNHQQDVTKSLLERIGKLVKE